MREKGSNFDFISQLESSWVINGTMKKIKKEHIWDTHDKGLFTSENMRDSYNLVRKNSSFTKQVYLSGKKHISSKGSIFQLSEKYNEN